MRHYFRIVLNLFFIVVSVGFIAPFLFSSPSDLGVLLGVVYLVFVFPSVLYFLNRNYIMKLVEKFYE